MDHYIRQQIERNRIESRFRVGGTNRPSVARSVMVRMAEYVHLFFAFVVIFSFLMIVSNWRSFAIVVDDALRSASVAHASAGYTIVSDSDGSSVSHISVPGDEFGLVVPLFPPDYRLEIPSLFEGTVPIRTVVDRNVDFARFYDQTENSIQEQLKNGVVRYPFTADPSEHGNVFITGHSSNYRWSDGDYNEVFALLHKLRKGDEYSIYFNGKKYTYRVFAQFEVQSDDVSVLSQPLDRKMSTLMTCTPLGTTLKRLIVQADLVGVEG
jgi:LPXTG-site transpeptidase (sortase) family protein